MSLLGTQLLLQRILRKPTSSGGGALTANSVNSSHIVDGSITGSDLSTYVTGIDTLTCSNFEAVLADITGSLGVASINLSGNLSCNATITTGDIVVNGSGAVENFTAYEAAVGSTLNVQLDVQAQLLVYATRSGVKAYGTATLVGGTVTVTNTLSHITQSLIFLSRNNFVNTANMGHLYVVKGNGSFQIKSTNASDNNVVDYVIIYGV